MVEMGLRVVKYFCVNCGPWSYLEPVDFQNRDHQRKKNPSLTNFERLPMTEKKYVITVAYETLR